MPGKNQHRLAALYGVVNNLLDGGRHQADSRELARYLGCSPEILRKDISVLGSGERGKAYDLYLLHERLEQIFPPSNCKAVLAGLGQIGQELLGNPNRLMEGMEFLAGFDSNKNRIELMDAPVPVYPSYEIAERVPGIGVKVAVMAVANDQVQRTADRLISAGIENIINLADHRIRQRNVKIRILELGWRAPILDFLHQGSRIPGSKLQLGP